LTNPERIVLEVADTYEKCASARAPSEPGGLGVEENGSGKVEVGLLFAAEQQGEARRRSRPESGEGNLAVTMVEREVVIDLVELAVIVYDRATVQDLLERNDLAFSNLLIVNTSGFGSAGEIDQSLEPLPDRKTGLPTGVFA
jgi:hypothetical protein